MAMDAAIAGSGLNDMKTTSRRIVIGIGIIVVVGVVVATAVVVGGVRILVRARFGEAPKEGFEEGLKGEHRKGSQVDGILGDSQMGESGIRIMDLRFLTDCA
ncbi:hypothetical protein COCNU_06G010390 [Cocos nucifera]|uniref:Uncharacterized protein n=1 Tax=Cocos nucifera TaxID=13894 RepID=A0A8K0IC32_COCNU|nr:hypothetical protein COCNU_06G010390 [Cocos nucifera]